MIDPMNSRDVLSKNVPGVGQGRVGWVGVMQWWGGVGGSCRGGVGHGGVGWAMQWWGGVWWVMEGWGGSWWDQVGHAGVGWVIQE